MSTLEKPTHEDEATVLAEGHPLHVGVWLSQYTYYYNEFIKGVISLTLKDPDTVIERVWCLPVPLRTDACCVPAKFGGCA